MSKIKKTTPNHSTGYRVWSGRSTPKGVRFRVLIYLFPQQLCLESLDRLEHPPLSACSKRALYQGGLSNGRSAERPCSLGFVMSHRAREKRGVSFRMGKKTPLLIPARALPRTSPPQDHPNSTLLGFRVKPHCLVFVFFFVWFVFVISSKCTFSNRIIIANSIWICLR